MKRRYFIKTASRGILATSVVSRVIPANLYAIGKNNNELLPTRPLGKTGVEVGILGLGGQATLEYEGRDEEAERIINRAIDLGINYFDTSAYYGWDKNGKNLPGVSERYIGRVMKTRRNKIYLASKTLERSYDGAMRELEQSLKNLQTDHIDLWQVHAVQSKEDMEKWFARDGAVKAFEKAKEEKIIKHIGMTGHKDPFAMKYGIDRYPFDTILMSLNAADRHDLSFIDNLLPIADEKRMGIIGMKIVARGKIFREGGISNMQQTMGYALTLPLSTIILGISNLDELEENVQVAKSFKPFSKQEMARLEELTKPYYEEATFYKYKW